MIYHIVSFILGFILDQIIGDPMNFPHPIRLIGNLISFFDRTLLGDVNNQKRDPSREKKMGILLCFLMLLITFAITGGVLWTAYFISPYIGIVAESILTCYILAAKSLRVESMKVYYALRDGTVEDARYAVSMIVGRDTAVLDEKGIIRAAVETVAENTSDGVIAPLIYTFLGGPVLGFMYKTVNTMDSMVGYHNDRYENFGCAPAKLDDIVNYIPARLSALLMILAAFIGGRDYSGKNAYRIFKRDRYNHKSPNSAQTESVCAGALAVRLAGDASYFGKVVKKPYIGDPIREIEADDIKRTCRLMYITEYLCALIMLGLWAIVYFLLK